MDAVVTFHSLDESGSVLSFAPSTFRGLIDQLVDDGVEFVAPSALAVPSPRDADRVALTFDDGMRSVLAEALPHLLNRGVSATVYVVTDFVGRDNRWPSQPAGAPVFDLMDWAELREWTAAGLHVGCHTATHPFLDAARPDSEWTRELADSRTRLQDELDTPIDSFAYPYGRYGPEAVKRIAGEFSVALTTRMRFVATSGDALLMPRLDSYYLQSAPRGLFGRASRAYLTLRASLRAVRGQ